MGSYTIWFTDSEIEHVAASHLEQVIEEHHIDGSNVAHAALQQSSYRASTAALFAFSSRSAHISSNASKGRASPIITSSDSMAA